MKEIGMVSGMFQVRRSGGKEPGLRQNCAGNLEYLTFPLLEGLEGIGHLVSTRLGGVSEDEFSSLNLSFSRGDKEKRVLENYRRIAEVLGCGVEDMVASHQVHGVNIRRVVSEDRGKGIIRERDYDDIDGLVTNERGIVLVTYYADCVPLLFADPMHGAIGLAHSGWRGTVNRMGGHMVEAMGQYFGSRPEDIYAAIGPSICQECYEVSEEVALQFIDLLGDAVALPGKASGKYQLDLWRANEMILRQAGVLQEHIAVTDICTCHNSSYLFSHRASGGKRGNFGAFLMLK